MGISPRIVTEDVRFLWDGVSARLPKGQVIDVAPGSPLERAIGAGRLVPMPGTAPQALPQEPPEPLAADGLITEAEASPVEPDEPAAAAKPAPAKKQDSAKEGDS
jgi:hypothetical protein